MIKKLFIALTALCLTTFASAQDSRYPSPIFNQPVFKTTPIIEGFELRAPAVSPSQFGHALVIGPSAAKNLNASSAESTVIGYWAGGSGGCATNWGGLLTCSPASLGGGTGMTGPQNTLIGWSAGTNMTTGAYNTALGVNTLGHEVDGYENVAVGVDAMRNGKTYKQSVAVGAHAMRNVDGPYNIAIGAFALSRYVSRTDPARSTAPNNITAVGINAFGGNTLTNGQFSVGVGNNVGKSVTTGSQMTGVGFNALSAVTTGDGNVGVGTDALKTITTANDNTAVGRIAGQNSTGERNAFLGSNAGVSTGSANDVVALGYGAAARMTGSTNVAVGSLALGGTGGVGNANTVVGYGAGNKITSGCNNTILGYNVGSSTLTTGCGNILIGNSNAVDVPGAGSNNRLNIANAVTGNMTPGSVDLSVAGPMTATRFVAPLTTPASSSAACATGTMSWDSSYIYVCTSTNSWKRAGLSAF